MAVIWLDEDQNLLCAVAIVLDRLTEMHVKEKRLNLCLDIENEHEEAFSDYCHHCEQNN